MTFMPPIIAPIVAPIATPGGAIPVAAWYLLGGVTAAQCVAAYQPKGAADLAASYVNLNNPGTNDAALGVAPTFAAATGWGFDGTKYLKTGVIPGSGWSMIYRFSGGVLDGSNHNLVGSYDGGSTFFEMISSSGGNNAYFNYGSGYKTISGYTSGVSAITGDGLGYYNGLQVVSSIGTWSGTSTRDVYMGGTNRSSGIYGAGNIQAVSIYNITLSSTQVGLIAAAMAAL